MDYPLPLMARLSYLLLLLVRSVACMLLPMARSVAASGLVLWVVPVALVPVAFSARAQYCRRNSRTVRLLGLDAYSVYNTRRIGSTSRLVLHGHWLARAVAFSSAGDLAPWPLARLGPSLLAVASSASALLVADVLERSLLVVAATSL